MIERLAKTANHVSFGQHARRVAGDTGTSVLLRYVAFMTWSLCGPTVLASAAEVSSQVAGLVTIKAGGATKVITIGEPTETFRASARWHVAKRLVLDDVRPLWRKADGSSLADDPSYRRREFTPSGDLVGRAVSVEVHVELWATTPGSATGITASVCLDDFIVSSHRYVSSWGRIESIDEDPTDVGRLPEQEIVLRAGRSGAVLARSNDEGTWHSKVGRRDVVRLARCAFGMQCSYDVELTSFARRAAPGRCAASDAVALASTGKAVAATAR